MQYIYFDIVVFILFFIKFTFNTHNTSISSDTKYYFIIWLVISLKTKVVNSYEFFFLKTERGGPWMYSWVVSTTKTIFAPPIKSIKFKFGTTGDRKNMVDPFGPVSSDNDIKK